MTKHEAHTPEPWQVCSDEICYRSEEDNQSFGMAVPLAQVYGEYYKANARRIVACVNACAGIPNEILESMPVGPSALEQQRDKLLAALVELVDDLEARAIDGVVPCGRSAYAKAKSALTGEPMLEYF